MKKYITPSWKEYQESLYDAVPGGLTDNGREEPEETYVEERREEERKTLPKSIISCIYSEYILMKLLMKRVCVFWRRPIERKNKGMAKEEDSAAKSKEKKWK